MNAAKAEKRDRLLARAAHAALPMLALVAFWLLVLEPLVQPGMMTCSHDGVMHLLRAFQLDTLVRQGILWPRWSPEMAFGYGYPLFNFYPILSLYPVLILHHAGQSLLQSWNLTLALSVLASGLTMYLWATQALGRRGGLVAAAAYMLAPYQLYDVYWRGSLTESLTLPLLPVGMWAALRVTQERRWRYALIGATAYAAILLTHAPASLMFTMVLLVYLSALVWGAQDRRRAVSQLAVMLTLGVGLAAFFLAPAYLEKDQVQLWRAGLLGGVDFRAYFLSLSDLFGPTQASDPLLVNPLRQPVSLGWELCLLSVVGVLATGWGQARIGNTHKRHVVWASLTLIGVILMMLPVSEPIWSHVPLLPFIQLPWRFLGVGSLLAGLLSGAGVAALDGHSGHDTLAKRLALEATTGVCVVMVAAGALPWAYPRLCPMPQNPDQAFSIAYEERAKTIGTSALAEYLPVAVHQVPTTSPLVKAMRAGQPVIRWSAPGARVLEAHDDGLSAELELESDTPVRVTYRAFYFPGWQAHLDEQPVSLVVVPPLGLMAMDAPAGHHRLTVQFESTPLRVISEVVSLIVALVIVTIWIYDLRSMPRAPKSETRVPGRPVRPLMWLGLTMLGLTLLALKVGVVDRYDTVLRWRRLQDGQFKGAMFTSNAVVAERARLLGYDVRPERIAAGDVIHVSLYWTLEKPLDLSAAIRLVDERGMEWNSSELSTASADYSSPPPSREWPVGAYADDRHAIQVLPGTPPGTLSLVVVPFKPDTLEPLPITVGEPAPGGYPGMVIGRLQITRPTRPPAVDALNLAVHTDVPLGADLTLVGYSQDREEAVPGQVMMLALGWQARRQPRADYTLRLELIAPDGQVVAQALLQSPVEGLQPGGDHYPTSHWAEGEVVLSQVLARVPGQAQSGQHAWRITLLESGSVPVGQTTLGRLQINAPQRVFAAPTMPRRVDARLGDWVALTGFDAPERAAPGQVLSITLVWQTLRQVDQDYKVFVHLLDADGRPVAQSDTVPAGWTRPTSGWQLGELVTDLHRLTLGPDLAPGEYRLVAGMYDADSGQRLPVANDGEVVELGKIQVSATENEKGGK